MIIKQRPYFTRLIIKKIVKNKLQKIYNKKKARNKLPTDLLEHDREQPHWCHSKKDYIIMLQILQSE